MAVDLEEFVQEPAMMYLTTWTWQDGKIVKRVPRSELPKRVAELIKFGIDFSVTRNP